MGTVASSSFVPTGKATAAIGNLSSAGELIEVHRQMIRTQQFQVVGTLEKIQFEKSTSAIVTPDSDLANNPFRSSSLDWYKTGAMIGESPRGDILICSKLPHPPRLPKHGWVPEPKYVTKSDAQGNVYQDLVPQEAPMVEQHLTEFASGVFRHRDGLNFLVMQPVHQLCLIAIGKCGWILIECEADGEGRHTMFLYNATAMEGYFLFGKKTINAAFL